MLCIRAKREKVLMLAIGHLSIGNPSCEKKLIEDTRDMLR